MNTNTQHVAKQIAKYFDVSLIAVDAEKNEITFELSNGQHLFFKGHTFHTAGNIGVLNILKRGDVVDFSFWPYSDNRLRRWPEQDIPSNPARGIFKASWSWRLEGEPDSRITLREGVVPGVSGQYIDDLTESVDIDIPPEFFDICALKNVSVGTVLRGFMADVCGLQNLVVNPRVDGFSSNGSDERHMARAYMDRAYF